MVSHWAGGLGSFYIQLLDPGYFACRSVRHKRTFAAVKCCWFLQILQTKAKQLPDSAALHTGRSVWRWIIPQLNWIIYKETKPCFTLSLFKDCCWPVNTEFLNGEECCTLPHICIYLEMMGLVWESRGGGQRAPSNDIRLIAASTLPPPPKTKDASGDVRLWGASFSRSLLKAGCASESF